MPIIYLQLLPLPSMGEYMKEINLFSDMVGQIPVMGNQIPCYFCGIFCKNGGTVAWRAKIETAKRQKFPANTLYLSYLIPSNVTTPP